MPLNMNKVRRPKANLVITLGSSFYTINKELRDFLNGETEFKSIKSYLKNKGFEENREIEVALYDLVEEIRLSKKLPIEKHKKPYFLIDKSQRNVVIKIYLFENGQVDEKLTKLSNSKLESDYIEIQPNAWFEDHLVSKKDQHIFFNSKTKKLKVVIHKNDIEDCKKNKDMILLGKGNVYKKTNGDIVFSGVEDFIEILSFKDREDSDKKELDRSRFVISIGSVLSTKENTNAMIFDENFKDQEKNVNLTNAKKGTLEKLKTGRYAGFINAKNKPVWLVVEEIEKFGQKFKQFAVFEKENDYVLSLKLNEAKEHIKQ